MEFPVWSLDLDFPSSVTVVVFTASTPRILAQSTEDTISPECCGRFIQMMTESRGIPDPSTSIIDGGSSIIPIRTSVVNVWCGKSRFEMRPAVGLWDSPVGVARRFFQNRRRVFTWIRHRKSCDSTTSMKARFLATSKLHGCLTENRFEFRVRLNRSRIVVTAWAKNPALSYCPIRGYFSSCGQ